MKAAENQPTADKVHSDLQKKRKFLEESRQLQHKAGAVEKECNAAIFNKRSEFRKEFGNLEELYEQYEKNGRSERLKLKQHLNKIKDNVDKLQRSLTNVKPSPKFVEKLKEIMEDIENSIMVYKAEQREKFEELLHDERLLTQELAASEKKFESWSRLPAASTESARAVKKATSARQTSSLPPAVAAFERFLLQTSGHHGGWDDYDHQEYLKLKQQHKTKNKDAFIHLALGSIPGKTYDDIRQHDDWYSEYLTLLDNKKKAIEEWKTLKDNEKANILEHVDHDEKNEERDKRKAELAEKERQDRLARLSEWKAQRNFEKEKEEEERARMEIEEVKDREKEEKRRREIKSQVEEYARFRETEKEILKMAEEKRKEVERQHKKLSATDVTRLRERNEKIVSERKTKLKSKELEQEEKEKRLDKLRSQVVVNAKRDPDRLLKLTEGLKERKKAAPSPGSSGRVMQMPHRAVPSWRQGIS